MPVIETTRAQVTSVPYVVDDLCHECPRCVARKACRTKAILQIDPGEAPFIDANLCYGCLACIPACPHGAITWDGQRATT